MRNETVDSFLRGLAARVPAPGGGATAALHAAQAAALMAMVARYSDGTVKTVVGGGGQSGIDVSPDGREVWVVGHDQRRIHVRYKRKLDATNGFIGCIVYISSIGR